MTIRYEKPISLTKFVNLLVQIKHSYATLRLLDITALKPNNEKRIKIKLIASAHKFAQSNSYLTK